MIYLALTVGLLYPTCIYLMKPNDPVHGLLADIVTVATVLLALCRWGQW
ncbi:hypothetical protein AB0K71_05835 [Streptomyces syringium]